MGKVVISGVGHDKPGIVSGLTEVLDRYGCNIEDSSMTILAHEFTMILIVSCPELLSLTTLSDDFKKVEAQTGITIFLKSLDDAPGSKYSENDFSPIMVSVAGHDRTGITYRVSKVMSEFGVNISDLNAQVIQGEDGAVYIMMVEAALYTSSDRIGFEKALQDLARELNVEIRVSNLEPLTL